MGKIFWKRFPGQAFRRGQLAWSVEKTGSANIYHLVVRQAGLPLGSLEAFLDPVLGLGDPGQFGQSSRPSIASGETSA
jgi:hypothetical protein